MKILLDECVPRAVKRHLKGHEVQTVPEAGWASKKNGELLSLCEGRFDVFLTVDQNLRFQQKLVKFRVAVILLLVEDNSIDLVLPLIPEVERVLRVIKPGDLHIIGE